MQSLHDEASSLPSDCALMPLARGGLLVSPAHAVFCPVGADQVEGVQTWLDGGRSDPPEVLRDNLTRHGFFGSPRPSEPDPPTVQLQITNDCNLRCTYCCTNSGEARPSEVGYDGFAQAVTDIRRVFGPGARVAIMGGEPLLVSWALDLAEDVLDADLSLVLFTNGLPLAGDKALTNRVAALGRRGAELRISLAGVTEDRCDAASGAGRFEVALAAVHALFDRGVAAHVDLMLLPEDAEHVATQLPGLRARLPTDTPITLGVLYHAGRATPEHLFASAAELEAALDRVAFGAGELVPAPERSPVTHRREGCDCALGKSLNVRSDGALFTCFKMEERVGHLDDGFAHIAAGLLKRPQRAATLPLCADCPLNTLCGGGCRAENLRLTGDADTPLCGPWRVRVVCELLAEDRVAALHWPASHLLQEARRRGIEAPSELSRVTLPDT